MIKLETIPHVCGVYIMKDRYNQIIYIGKARDLSKRVRSYFTKDVGYKISIILSLVKTIEYIITSSEKEALLLESKLIKKYQPPFNVIWRDDKSYPHLKLTLFEPFPRLYLTRKIVDDGSKYFGPYTHVYQLRRLLGVLRRLFPLRVCKYTLTTEVIKNRKIKPCLYFYIKQCLGPCTGKITDEEYKETVNDVILFLNGNFRQLIKAFKRKMHTYAKKLEFEKAAKYRDSIKALENMFAKISIREISKEAIEERIEISKALNEIKQLTGIPRIPINVEIFDISNISGKEPVGSMVSFHQGLPDKSKYKRFEIKTVKKINDYAMISEVLTRRYKRILENDEQPPDLIIIDGGKGHLTAALKTLETLKLNLPVISIAKKRERVYSPYTDREISFPDGSAGLKLLQMMRNEAHRFAITYHKLKRKKALIS